MVLKNYACSFRQPHCSVTLDKHLPDFPQAIRPNWAAQAWWNRVPLVCIPYLLVSIVVTAVAGGFLQLCRSVAWYLVMSEWSVSCVPLMDQSRYLLVILWWVSFKLQNSSLNSGTSSLWPGLEEMLEINKRLFDRIASENATLTRIWCGCGNNSKVSELMVTKAFFFEKCSSLYQPWKTLTLRMKMSMDFDNAEI